MIKHSLSFIVPAVLALAAPAAVHASETIVSTAPLSGGASMRAALEAATTAPTDYPGPNTGRGMEGKVMVRFHVGQDGHPDDIKILQGARHGALNLQTRRSVASAYCADCAGKDYLATFNYQTK